MKFSSTNTDSTGHASFIAQGSAVTLFTPGADSTFLIGATVDITAGASSSVSLDLQWTDVNGAQSATIATANQASNNGFASGVICIRALNGDAVSFYTSGSGSPTYDLHFTVTGVE